MGRNAACLFAFLTALAFAGCTGPPVWTPAVPGDAPQEGGLGPREVAVHVTDDSGPASAVVILAWLDPVEPQDIVHVHRLGLRSVDGTVIGHVPDDREVHIMAAGSRTTEEWIFDAFGPGTADTVNVRVYGLEQGMRFNDTWEAVEAGFFVSPWFPDRTVWHPTPLQLSPDQDANLAIQDRIEAMEGHLVWDNTPTAFGDFGMLAATQADGSGCYQQDDRRDLGPGTFEQGFEMPYSSRCNWLLPGLDDVTNITPPINIGPATSDHLVAPPDGVPYTVEVNVSLIRSWGWQPFNDEWGDRELKLHWAPVDEEQARAGERQAAPAAGLLAVLTVLGLAVVRRRASDR